MSKREFRYIPAKELRVATKDGKNVLSGYASVFNSLSEDLGGFREMVMPNAFDKCLATNPDVVCLRDHDPKFLLGRTKSGTLKVYSDEVGLRFDCELPATTQAADVSASIERGDLDSCSFGMYCLEDSWKNDAGIAIRSIVEAEVFDVSVVTYPAYTATSVNLRSLFPDGDAVTPPVEEKSAPKEDKGMACACDCPECVDGNCADCTDCTDPDCTCDGMNSRSLMAMKVKLAESF